MTADLISSDSSLFLNTLTAAAIAFRDGSRPRPAAVDVVTALLQAEKAAKRQRLVYPMEALNGQWRLGFATGTRKARQRGGIFLGQGFYMPKLVPAYIKFATAVEQPTRGEISNQLRVGGVSIQLTGPFQYLGKKNLLAFDFTQMQIRVLGQVLYDGSVGKRANQGDFYEKAIAHLPFFAFFCVTPDLIAARGRGGGLAIWIRE